jgi:hypothetical protein
MTHPDDKVEDKFAAQMRVIAEVVDEFVNKGAKGNDRKVCFVLLITEFAELNSADAQGRVSYMSNGARSDVITMMKEAIARFEGQPEMKGRA